jgi:hypothetical protein
VTSQYISETQQTGDISIYQWDTTNSFDSCAHFLKVLMYVGLIESLILKFQELHAHINGSVSESTIQKLLSKKQNLDHQFSFKKGSTATLKE